MSTQATAIAPTAVAVPNTLMAVKATPSAPTSTSPAADPAERLMFQLTDLSGNHNKFYLVEMWPVDSRNVRYRASWGRVGSRAQTQEKVVPRTWVDSQIAEKLRKGYRRVDLHRPDVEFVAPDGSTQPAHPPLDPAVKRLVDWIFLEAGEHIHSFLSVEVEALSQAQIVEGRNLLAAAQQQHAAWAQTSTRPAFDALAETVQAYYNTIPTRLPGRLDRDEIVRAFCKDFNEQEDRLLQLEAAIATMKVQRQHPGSSPYESLGAELKVLPASDPAHAGLVDHIMRTLVHGYAVKVRDIFEVCIPAERDAYAQNKKGLSRRELLFHGTPNRNVRHILRQGLICPQTPSHGRMLGNGIYLANRASKSVNYCRSSRVSVPRMLFVVEAALGRCYVAPEAKGYSNPPLFHDSVCGKAGHTRVSMAGTLVNDEFVVYSPAQQTIRYLVTFDR